jgi:hypothetical protein
VVAYDETIDKNMPLLSGGGNFDTSSINPALLPVDKNGKPVYPHQFLKVNTIFNVAHQAGLFTAFSDKHPAYDIASGPSGNGINEIYSPELNSNTALLNIATDKTVNADALAASDPGTDLSAFKLVDASTDPLGAKDPNLELTTNNVLLTEKYDDLKVQAILNEIKGMNPLGTASANVPNLFAMNFQEVSVAEKFIDGGIDQGASGEIVSPLLQSALQHTDASVGQIEAALKSAGLWPSTMLVLTAKHGQTPRVGVAHLIKDDTLTNVLSSAGITTAGTSQDDGALLWLANQKQTSAAVHALQSFQSTGTINVYLKGVASTIPASQVIKSILSAPDLVADGLGNPSANSRTPDIIVTLNPGYILVGNPLKFTYKRAEHGGFSPTDTNIALIVSGGKVSSAVDGMVVNDHVKTTQIAVTALQALGLKPSALQGAVAEHTRALPGLTPVTTKPARPSHVVIVIEENHDLNQLVNSPNAPYLNNTLKANGLYFANAHGTDHDSQPNYLELFSGANPGVQGVNSPLQPVYPLGVNPSTDPAAANRENNSDNYNINQPFSVDNLGAELRRHSASFTGYSEDLPSVGFTGPQYPVAPGLRSYVEKHNPWAQFQGSGTNQLPASTNQPLTAFPSDFNKLPNVSFVVPNEKNDLHDTVSLAGGEQVGKTGKDANGNPANAATTVQHGDNWLKDHVEAYRKWAATHNSLLIVLYDENDFNFASDNNIPLIVDGDPRLVQKGTSYQYVNHFNTLRTIEDMFGTGHAGLSGVVAPYAANAKGTLVPA